MRSSLRSLPAPGRLVGLPPIRPLLRSNPSVGRGRRDTTTTHPLALQPRQERLQGAGRDGCTVHGHFPMFLSRRHVVLLARGLGREDSAGLVVGEYCVAAAADKADDCGIVFPPLSSLAVAEPAGSPGRGEAKEARNLAFSSRWLHHRRWAAPLREVPDRQPTSRVSDAGKH